MGLFSIFSRSPQGGGDTASIPSARDAVQQARVRARRRLIGAVVLVAIGVIGFPLLFESTPRPIPVDIPIEIPARDASRPLPMPAARPQPPAGGVAPPAEQARETGPGAGVGQAQEKTVERTPEKSAEKASDKAADTPADKATDAPAAKPTDKAVDKAVAMPTPEPPAAVKAPTPSAEARAAEAARAKALLEGRPVTRDGGPAYVVQVGAFADATGAQDVRRKVEKLGLKAFTQVTQTAQGSRVRVRLGPYASREEAEKVADRIKAAGLGAAVMTP